MELADSNVKISCIEPGLVMTDLHREWDIKKRAPTKELFIAVTLIYYLGIVFNNNLLFKFLTITTHNI